MTNVAASKKESSPAAVVATRRRDDRFDANDEPGALLRYLDQFGYVVVANALSSDELVEARDLLWDFLESATGGLWCRSDGRTWTDDGLDRVADRGPENGVLHKGGVGQSSVAWYVRERAASVFKTVWRDDIAAAAAATDDDDDDSGPLISSFDGLCVFRPWRRRGGDGVDGEEERRTISRPWFHTDQGRRSPKGERCCVQGLVTLFPQNEATTGGLVLIPESHRAHDRLLDELVPHEDTVEYPDENPDYVEVRDAERVRATHGLPPPLVVEAEAGDAILWDSRLLHCNTAAASSSASKVGATTTSPKNRLLRAAVYVCMVPRFFASSKTLAERRKAFLRGGATTSHWPHDPCFRVTDYYGDADAVGPDEKWRKTRRAVRRLV